jgi:hypothetical protein
MRYRPLVVSAILFVACDSATEPSRDVPPPAEVLEVRVTAVTPTELSATVGTEVTPVPTVLATDQYGRPLKGVTVLFALGVNGGKIANESVTTDSLGLQQWESGRSVTLPFGSP